MRNSNLEHRLDSPSQCFRKKGVVLEGCRPKLVIQEPNYINVYHF